MPIGMNLSRKPVWVLVPYDLPAEGLRTKPTATRLAQDMGGARVTGRDRGGCKDARQCHQDHAARLRPLRRATAGRDLLGRALQSKGIYDQDQGRISSKRKEAEGGSC